MYSRGKLCLSDRINYTEIVKQDASYFKRYTSEYGLSKNLEIIDIFKILMVTTLKIMKKIKIMKR